ncbi:hypothetical protein [Lentzea sp. NPDC059081]|uniref:hypothetical protein n=1 Tax=Lentzea sp. NPDC059081 TaxID=3346719 RepID=UPI0036ACBF6B
MEAERASAEFVKRMESDARFGERCVIETAEGEVLAGTLGGSMVLTPLPGDQLVTTLSLSRGVVTTGAFGRLEGHLHDDEQRLDLVLGDRPFSTFTLARNNITVASAMELRYGVGGAGVSAAGLQVQKDASRVRVRVSTGLGTSAFGASYDHVCGVVRVPIGESRSIVGRVGEDRTTIRLADEVVGTVGPGGRMVVSPMIGRTSILLEDDRVLVRDGEVLLALHEDHVELRCGHGVVRANRDCWELVRGGKTVRWRRPTDEVAVVLCEHGELVVDKDTAIACETCGAALPAMREESGAGVLDLGFCEVYWTPATTTLSIGEHEIAVTGTRHAADGASPATGVLVRAGCREVRVEPGRITAGNAAEQWQVTAQGEVCVGTSVITREAEADGGPALVFRALGRGPGRWLVSARGDSALIDDGRGLRAEVDRATGATFSTTSYASTVVSARPTGAVVVTATGEEGTAVLHLDDALTARLRFGAARLTIEPEMALDRDFCAVVEDEASDFAMIALDSGARGLSWTTVHLGSSIGHSISARGTLTVHNSPSRAVISATTGSLRVVPPDSGAVTWAVREPRVGQGVTG